MEDRKESIKKALLTIKKECSSNEDCNKCQVKKILGDCVQSFYVPTPENWIPENWTTQRR
jgi:hypothetical protein